MGFILALGACAGTGSSEGGLATYDTMQAAQQACASRGGQLRLKRNGDPQYLGDFACERN